VQTIWPTLVGVLFFITILALWAWSKSRKHIIRMATFEDDRANIFLTNALIEFRKAHPRIQVELLRFSFLNYVNELKSAIHKGLGPDVLLLEFNHYTDLVFSDLLEPVYPYFLNDRMTIVDYYPQLIDRCIVNGFLNAVPRDATPICMLYYNKKAFDEAGLPYPPDDWNWDQFVEVAKKVMKVDDSGNVLRWGYVECWANFENWIYNAGGTYVDDIKHPSRWTFTEDANTRNGIQFRLDLIYKHQVMPPPSIWNGVDNEKGAEMFANGSAAIFLGGLWNSPKFREIKDFGWDAAMVPRCPGGSLDFLITGSAYGICKASRDVKNAWKLVKFLLDEKRSIKLAETGHAQPANMKISNSPVFLDQRDPLNKKMLLDAMKRGKFHPLCRNWAEVERLIEMEFSDVWKNETTIDEAMERLKTFLEKNPPQPYTIR
jgi:multiple sugar transport system substrate-binding protein